MSKTTVFRVSDCSCGVKIKTTTKKEENTHEKKANKKKKITTDKLTTENEEKYQAKELIKATEYCVAKIQK